MRTNQKTCKLRLNAVETATWRRIMRPDVRGRDLGRRWTMRDEIEGRARRLAIAVGAEHATVELSDGEVVMVVPAVKPEVVMVRHVRRGAVA
jgi:hypothetical protein